MSEPTFTHKDLAELLEVSETTIKSYRRKFPGCMPVINNGKPIRFGAEAAAVAKRIRDMFEEGLSIGEVRTRLVTEFSWISQQKSKPAATEKKEASPELTLGVSNMAKSLVALTQQQKIMLTRMQGIESMLEDLGLQGQVDGDALRQKKTDTARQQDEQFEVRLQQLDGATQELAHTVVTLAGQLERLLDSNAATQQAHEQAALQALLQQQQAGQAVTQEKEAESEPPCHHTYSDTLPEVPAPAKIIPLRPPVEPQPKVEPQVVGQAASQEVITSVEPPRQLLSLPLVVRTGQGQYISAGGRGRGRFCVNDLKAMLIYGFTPPNHFILRWDAYGQGWWLTLEQNNGDRIIQLLLMELPTQKGNTVAEILQLKNNEQTVHPAEMCSIIDSLTV